MGRSDSLRILVLGGYGAMGQVIVRDLLESGAEVVIAGNNLERAENLIEQMKKEKISNVQKAEVLEIDAEDENLVGKIHEAEADVLVNSVIYTYNLIIMDAAIAAEINYVDLGGLYHMTLKQLALDKKAKEAGVSCILGMGSTPGTTNVMAHFASHKFSKVERVDIRSGWKNLEGSPLIVPYALKTLYGEYTMPAPVLRNGKIKFANPLAKKISFSFPGPLGKVSGHFTIHSELATMPTVLKAKRMDFAVAFPREFDSAVSAVVRKYKKFGEESALAELGKVLAVPEISPLDIDGQRIDMYGKDKKGKKLFVRMDAITDYHKKWKQSAGTVDTSVPSSIAAQWLAGEKITSRGVLPPGIALHGLEKEFFSGLNKRGRGIKVFEQINDGPRRKMWK